MAVYYNKIVRMLLSRTFAVYLLGIMLAFLVVGSILPDVDMLETEELGMFMKENPWLFEMSTLLRVSRLMVSPYFLALPVVIFLSTTVCTAKRISARRRKEGGFSLMVSGRTAKGLDELGKVLSESRWRLTRSEDALIADKGAYGFWGSMVFHLGLLLIFVAVVVSSRTQLNAELVLTEGFPVVTGRAAFARISAEHGIESFPRAELLLTQFVPSYENDIYKKDFAAHLLIDGEERIVRVNQPVNIENFRVSLHRYGFAPSFRITNAQGKELLNATIKLIVLNNREDSFTVPDTPYEVFVRLFPDAEITGKEIGSRSTLPKNPILAFRVKERGREIGRGLLPLNKTVSARDLRISFDGLNYWAGMTVSRDHGLWVFTISYVLIMLGLTVRFALPDKQLIITVKDNALSIKGWCKYYPAYFEEELNHLREKIETEGPGEQT